MLALRVKLLFSSECSTKTLSSSLQLDCFLFIFVEPNLRHLVRPRRRQIFPNGACATLGWLLWNPMYNNIIGHEYIYIRIRMDFVSHLNKVTCISVNHTVTLCSFCPHFPREAGPPPPTTVQGSCVSQTTPYT